MIVNPYAILDTLVAILRLPLAVALVALGTAAWLRMRRALSPEERTALENRYYLLITLAVVVQWLNFLSWPLFYLLLQSYVVEWPGIMCIYGVTQIGVGSTGPSQWLPPLILGLQLFKPALVFGSGAWFALYQLNRQTRTGPLVSRVLLLLLAQGLLAIADAAAELTYLAIPKKAVFPWSGCCTEAIAAVERTVGPTPLFGAERESLLIGAYVGLLGILCILLAVQGRRPASVRPILLTTTAVLACLALPVSYAFLTTAVAPRILHWPEHACAYDLLPRSPATIVAVVLHFLACFTVGWANLVYWLGNHAEAVAIVPGRVKRWLCVAFVSYPLSMAAVVFAMMIS